MNWKTILPSRLGGPDRYEIGPVEALPARPDLLICDGQGIAHPRRIGLASHVGLRLGLPTIGAAKSRLCGEHREPGVRRRSAVQLRHEGEVVGKVIRTRTGVRPIYVSVGHQVTLTDAVRWVLRAARGRRLPEPTRQAHLLVTSLKRRQGASSPRTERTRTADGDTDRNSESDSGP